MSASDHDDNREDSIPYYEDNDSGDEDDEFVFEED